MSKFVLVEPNGEVLSYRVSGSHYDDRSMLDGKLVVHVDELLDFGDKYWDFDTEEFLDKPAKPGDYYEWIDGAWVLNKPALIKELKAIRTRRLRAIDWTQLPDVTLTPAQITAWRTYRQELRDLPSLYPDVTSIDEVVWPTPPS